LSNLDTIKPHKAIRLSNKKSNKEWLSKIEKITDLTQQNYFSYFPEESRLNGILKNAFVLNQPMNQVGGDGYWMHNDGNNIFLAIFDCIGEGHLASMMTRIYTKALKKLIVDYDIIFPGSILQFIHREIQARFKDKKHMVDTGADLGIIKIDLDHEVLDFAGARMNLLQIKDDQLEVIQGDQLQIGELFDYKHEYNTVKIDTSEPSSFYLMSDGLAALRGGDSYQPLGEETVKGLLKKHAKKPMSEQKELLRSFIEEWKGTNNQSDDVLVVGFQL
jgi:serine phosphatase RsbU (regulator of sigma subunit)